MAAYAQKDIAAFNVARDNESSPGPVNVRINDDSGKKILAIGIRSPREVLHGRAEVRISVDYDGRVYDCDFNQMLALATGGERPVTVFDLDLAALQQVPIALGPHCFGCTAGAGSSCGGATA